ncbi:MAG TPA: hypothetical protein VFV66_02980 [Nonomuraea sp.]|nr:hypothetical protein [Nonomuraea sp.]
MYGPARLANGRQLRERRQARLRRARLANIRRDMPPTAAVMDPAAIAAAWTSPTGLPNADLTTAPLPPL